MQTEGAAYQLLMGAAISFICDPICTKLRKVVGVTVEREESLSLYSFAGGKVSMEELWTKYMFVHNTESFYERCF